MSGGGRLDVLRGAGGADVFEFTDQIGARNTVHILDFDAVEGDLIDLGGAEISNVRELGVNTLLQLGNDGDSILIRGVAFDELAFADGGLIVG